jgi:hypothetical protein
VCFDPDPGATTQWFVRAVDDLAWAINQDFVVVVVVPAVLDSQHWFSFTSLVVASDHVLVHVDDGLGFGCHSKYPSVLIVLGGQT